MRITIGSVTSLVVLGVISLTLSSCTYIQRNVVDDCKNRAFIGSNLKAFVTARFHNPEAVRLGIVPFSSAANLAPEIGRTLAMRVHQELLPSGDVPIVEIFNREDWPGKRDEFYSGNFGAISIAREAQYDLVLVGMVAPLTRLDEMTLDLKVIEVESGTTAYYGRSVFRTGDDDVNDGLSSLWLSKREPSALVTPRVVDRLARCAVRGLRQVE
jgi:hypothetical protein